MWITKGAALILGLVLIRGNTVFGFVVCCAIWYHLYNSKNVKNAHGGVLLLVKLQAYNLKNMKNTHRGVLLLVKL